MGDKGRGGRGMRDGERGRVRETATEKRAIERKKESATDKERERDKVNKGTERRG